MFPIDQGTLAYLNDNGDVLFCYFSLGLLLQSPVTVMRYFLVDNVGLGPAELAEVAALVAFPWAVKPLTAFFSESIVSSCVERRLQIACAFGLAGLCWFAFLFVPQDRDGLRLVVFCAFLSSFFNSFADVCLDASMVRRVHTDSADHGNGRLQSFVLAFRAFGGLVGSFLSGVFALLSSPFLFIAILHLVGVVAGWKLKSLPIQDRRQDRLHKDTCKMCSETLKALIYPERVIFVAVLFAIATPVSDFAIMQYFYQHDKGVQPMIFSIADVIASVMMIAASLFFNAFLRQRPWQSIVMLSQCVLLVVLATNMLVITGLLTIDAGVYLILRNIVSPFFGHIGFMPLAVRAADLVPIGLEGTFYSLYMSTVNLGSVVGEELSGLLTRVLGTSTKSAIVFYYIIATVHNMFSYITFHIAYGS